MTESLPGIRSWQYIIEGFAAAAAFGYFTLVAAAGLDREAPHPTTIAAAAPTSANSYRVRAHR